MIAHKLMRQIKMYKVMMFTPSGVFEKPFKALIDAEQCLQDVINAGQDNLFLKLVVVGPETWIEHDPYTGGK